MTDRNIEYAKTVMANAISGSRREKNVLMFHVGRSGSTVLGDLFNQNQNIFWDSEFFMRNRLLPIARPLTKLIFAFPARVVRARRMRTTKPIYGFEAKLTQVSHVGMSLAQFVTAMQRLDFDHFILLRRRNHLRVIISHLRAEQQGYWHRPVQGSAVSSAPARVEVNVDSITMGSTRHPQRLSLIDHLQATEQDFNQLNLLLDGQSVLNLVYEDHIESDPTDAYRRVCHFLDIAPSAVQVQRKKTNPWPTKELVSNYDELAQALAGSPYEWMLESEQNSKPQFQ